MGGKGSLVTASPCLHRRPPVLLERTRCSSSDLLGLEKRGREKGRGESVLSSTAKKALQFSPDSGSWERRNLTLERGSTLRGGGEGFNNSNCSLSEAKQ